MNNEQEVKECPDIHRDFASLNDRCHKKRKMNGASQQKLNCSTPVGYLIKKT